MDTDLERLMARTTAWVYDANRRDRLHDSGVLLSTGSLRLQELCERAAVDLDAMAAAATAIDGDTQCFLAFVGLKIKNDAVETSSSFCHYVGATGDTFAVDYAPDNVIVCDFEAVTLMGIHAYLGVPLLAPNGEVIGAFCVFDDRLRNWSSYDEQVLKDYSVLATAVLIMEKNERGLLR